MSIKQRVSRALGTDRLLRGVVVLAGGTALSQVVVLLASPILTRLYTPGDFGVLALYAAVVAIGAIVSALRYENALPLERDDPAAASLLLLCLALTLGTSALAVGLVAVAPGTWQGALLPHRWLVPIGLLGAGLYQVFSYWAIRGRRYGRIAGTRFRQGVGQTGAQLVLGMLQIRPAGLLIGEIVGRFWGAASLVLSAFRDDRVRLDSVSLRSMRAAARRYRKFPLVSVWSGLLGTLGLQLPVLLLAVAFSQQIVGLFALSQRVLMVPIVFLGRAVGQVFLAESSEAVSRDPRAVETLFHALTRRLFLLALPPAAILAFTGPALFEFVYGAEWRLAGRYAAVLTPIFVGQFVLSPVAQLFNVLERQEQQLTWDILRVVGVAGALVLGIRSNDPLTAVAYYSAAQATLYIGLYLSYLNLLRRSRLEERPAD